jgi:hypothetical protein
MRIDSGYLTLQRHTLRLCNACFFSAATIFAGLRLSVALYLLFLAKECSGKDLLVLKVQQQMSSN